jgi:hypothetical protein
MKKLEIKKLVTLVCERCKGYAVIEGTPYPSGPSTIEHCPFCGSVVESRSAWEKAILTPPGHRDVHDAELASLHRQICESVAHIKLYI